MRTNCETCCFAKQDKQGKKCCVADQFCILNDDGMVAPGCCRLKRDASWVRKQSSPDDIMSLLALAQKEMSLKFHLIVLFDEWLHYEKDLVKTIDSKWMDSCCDQITIADISGDKDRSTTSLDFLRTYLEDQCPNRVALQVDQSVDSENPVRAVRRLARQIKSPYFLVLPAGKVLSGICELKGSILNDNHRCIFWNFPQVFGNTRVFSKDNDIFGLYLTKIFQQFSSRCTEECLNSQPCSCLSFLSDISDMEISCEVHLSHNVIGCDIQ